MGGTWLNRIILGDARHMDFLPDDSIDLWFTSPMYRNAGMKYPNVSDVMPFDEYCELHERAWAECYRSLKPGGRLCIVVANIGRDPYERLDAVHAVLAYKAGFLDRGTIIWYKGPVFGTAWGSWRRPTAPRLRDVHEYILVLERPGKKQGCGYGDIDASEFCAATQSLWSIPPASAKKIGFPSPFPVELAMRAIRLLTYPGDIVGDCFLGSGSTAVAANLAGRHYVGIDIDPDACILAEKRIAGALTESVNSKLTTGISGVTPLFSINDAELAPSGAQLCLPI